MSARNINLNRAKAAKRDEFYTLEKDVAEELQHYEAEFRDKVVFVNCDNPEWSNFWRFFNDRFEELGLAKLISCHYEEGGESYSMQRSRGDLEPARFPVDGDGDFRSEGSKLLLAEADVVVTNPPFSLFREFLAQLVEADKKFLILGSMNAIGYKEVWPLLEKGDMRLGVTRGSLTFEVPDEGELTGKQKIGEDGKRYQAFGNIVWYTNLDSDHEAPFVELTQSYYEEPEKYPKYDNYEAINVDRVKDIPADYDGEMGVPISFLTKHNPKQFELTRLLGTPIVGEKKIYKRISVRRVG